MKMYSVKETAKLLNKHPETIKRWLRKGNFPNALISSDKEGWKIPQQDLEKYIDFSVEEYFMDNSINEHDEQELIKLAFEAVTLTSPTDEIISILSVVGIKRTLEILLIMQQSPKKVKNVHGFIKAAIKNNWGPNTVPKRKLQLNRQQHPVTVSPEVPFYNWLED